MRKINPKTYLLAVVLMLLASIMLLAVSMPAVGWGPKKLWSGIHLGNRPDADWNDILLARIDGEKGGTWPKAIVALSSQVYNLQRDNNCRIKTGANDTTVGRAKI